MKRVMPLCLICKHFISAGEYCKAYPDGIPEAVYWTGHFLPKPDDNGVQFEARDDADKEFVLIYKERSQDEDERYRNYGKLPLNFAMPTRKKYNR